MARPRLSLDHWPILESLHVYLNGLEQQQDVDWTLLSAPPRVQAELPMPLLSTDKWEARYAWTESDTGGGGAPSGPNTYPLPAGGRYNGGTITDPAQALPNCGGGAFPWQSADATAPFTLTGLGTVVSKPNIYNFPFAIGDCRYNPAYAGVGGSGAMYLDGWAYLRKPDGCLYTFNFVTGNISTTGYTSSYNLDLSPGAYFGAGGIGDGQVPDGSILVAASMTLSAPYPNNGKRLYQEESP